MLQKKFRRNPNHIIKIKNNFQKCGKFVWKTSWFTTFYISAIKRVKLNFSLNFELWCCHVQNKSNNRIVKNLERKLLFHIKFLANQCRCLELPRKWKMKYFHVFPKNYQQMSRKSNHLCINSKVGATIKWSVHISALWTNPSFWNWSWKMSRITPFDGILYCTFYFKKLFNLLKIGILLSIVLEAGRGQCFFFSLWDYWEFLNNFIKLNSMCGKIKLMDSRNSQVDRCLNFISSLFGGKTERKFLKTSENIDEQKKWKDWKLECLIWWKTDLAQWDLSSWRIKRK
jgi:hypothetical protein